MVTLRRALEAWGTAQFEAVFKDELCRCGPSRLPLQEATCHGGYVDEHALSATVLRSHDHGDCIEVVTGVFFQEVEMACSCGDEPQASPAYCQLRVRIAKGDGVVRFEQE